MNNKTIHKFRYISHNLPLHVQKKVAITLLISVDTCVKIQTKCNASMHMHIAQALNFCFFGFSGTYPKCIRESI